MTKLNEQSYYLLKMPVFFFKAGTGCREALQVKQHSLNIFFFFFGFSPHNLGFKPVLLDDFKSKTQ